MEPGICRAPVLNNCIGSFDQGSYPNRAPGIVWAGNTSLSVRAFAAVLADNREQHLIWCVTFLSSFSTGRKPKDESLGRCVFGRASDGHQRLRAGIWAKRAASGTASGGASGVHAGLRGGCPSSVSGRPNSQGSAYVHSGKPKQNLGHMQFLPLRTPDGTDAGNAGAAGLRAASTRPAVWSARPGSVPRRRSDTAPGAKRRPTARKPG
jgi:hypothetical protein